MGSTVLDAGPAPSTDLHVYAHCLPKHAGGVALLVINTDRDREQSFSLSTVSERYTLTARNLTDKQVSLNGAELKLGENDSLPAINGADTKAGLVTLPPASITFLAVQGAGNASCAK